MTAYLPMPYNKLCGIKLLADVLFCFCFLGLHLQHMEVPRLEVESELQLLAYTTAAATRDPSCVCNLHHSSWQCQILNPLSKPREVASWILVGLLLPSHNGNCLWPNILTRLSSPSEIPRNKEKNNREWAKDTKS